MVRKDSISPLGSRVSPGKKVRHGSPSSCNDDSTACVEVQCVRKSQILSQPVSQKWECPPLQRHAWEKSKRLWEGNFW